MRIQFTLLSIIFFSALLVIIPGNVSAETDEIILASVDRETICSGIEDNDEAETCRRQGQKSVHFTDSNNGWAVGTQGTILHTSNGGDSWARQTSGVSENLFSVHFTDSRNGWAVGKLGTILHTSNGGTTWAEQTSGVSSTDLHSVHFTDSSNGWIVGTSGTILHTINGGDDWDKQTNDVRAPLQSVHFIDNNKGWAVGNDGTMLHTINGGTTWTPQTNGVTGDLNSVHFTDSSNGWAVGAVDFGATILRTINGGTTWDLTPTSELGLPIPDTSSPSTTFSTLNSVHFASSKDGLAVGSNSQGGIALHTTDGGNTWNKVVVHTENLQTLSSVHIVDNTNAFAVGTVTGDSSPIHHISEPTPDIKSSGGSSSDGDVSAQTDEIILASVDYTRISCIDDEGNVVEQCNDRNQKSVYFTDSRNGWTVGLRGNILYTSNAGDTWNTQTSGVTVELESVYFTDSNNGWVVGGDGTILHTIDGGTTWAKQTNVVNTDLYSVYFTDSNNGWVVGRDGTILHTINGGTTWAKTIVATEALNSVHFIDNNKGWAVGDGGKILHTSNGGDTWAEQTNGVTGNLNSVYFTDSSNGWAVGFVAPFNAIVLRTTDGGTTWDLTPTDELGLSSSSLNSVHFANSKDGLAVGLNGTLGIALHTTDGGDTWSKVVVHPENPQSLKSLSSVHIVDNTNAFAVGTAANGDPIHHISGPIVSTLDIKSSGGSSSDWKKKPTFGKSWEVTSVQLVENGFTFNEYSLDITDNWHTDFTRTSAIIGDENHVDIKVYTDKILNSVTLSLGVPEVGDVSHAETDIIIQLQRNYTNVHDYDIVGTVHEQKESLVDVDKTMSSISKVKCTSISTDEMCYMVGIDFTVNAPLKSEVLAISAVDTNRRSTVTYINEGVEFTGESLLPANTHSFIDKKTSQSDADAILLTQQDRRYQIWEDNYGYLWTVNNYGTWLQITTPDFERHEDAATSVMTRAHSGFAQLMMDEGTKATLVFDSATIQSEVGESFVHAYPTVLDRSLDPILLENMKLEEILALEKSLNRFIYDDEW